MRDPRLDDEIRHHIEERADRLMAEGVPEMEARRRAEAAFGSVEAVREEVARIQHPRRSLVGRTIERVRLDVGFALRQVRRSPGYALVAILTLALGIGASSAIFGLVKAVVLEPLPYPEADRLVLFNEVAPDGVTFTVSMPNYRDFRDRIEGLELLTATNRADYATEQDGRPRRVVAGTVTAEFFPLFGAAPALGRAFTRSEVGMDPASVVVLSHAFWADHFGADSSVVGRTLALDGMPHEVVGVAAPGWMPGDEVDVWTPMGLAGSSRGNHDHTVMGRLAPGVGLAAAQTEAEAVADALGREYPESNGNWGVRLTPLKEAVVGTERLQAGSVLLGAVALLLLMACASVSNLLLARASVRGREMTLRATLGAGRARLVQQLLTESLLLSGAAAAAGLGLAQVFLPLLRTVSPADTPRLDGATIDGTVVLFAVGAAATCALLFGLAPVLHVLRDALSARAGHRAAGGASDRMRMALVSAQVALSLTLLVGAGALARSFLALQDVDTGLPVEEALVVPLMMSGDRYTMPERSVTRDELMRRLAALPGVAAVGSSNVLPYSGMNTMVGVNVEGRPVTSDQAPFVRWRAVSEGFLPATGLTPLAGRLLQRSDYDMDAEDVVVLSATMARMLFESPAAAVGGRVAMGWNGTNYRRVVGVVPDMEDLGVSEAAPALFFFPDPGALPWVNLLVRLDARGTRPAVADIREAIWAADPNLPVPSVEPLSARYRGTVAGYGFNLLIMGVFAGVALVLSLLGIYGLVLFAVERRTREIGVRMALGARPGGVVTLVLGQGLRLTAFGLVAGVGLSLALARFLEALLFRTAPTDPVHIVLPALLLGAAAALATWLPASRATRVAPSEALRSE